MAEMQIKTESLPERCDICHQTDQFDPKTGKCRRCKEISSQFFDQVENLNVNCQPQIFYDPLFIKPFNFLPKDNNNSDKIFLSTEEEKNISVYRDKKNRQREELPALIFDSKIGIIIILIGFILVFTAIAFKF